MLLESTTEKQSESTRLSDFCFFVCVLKFTENEHTSTNSGCKHGNTEHKVKFTANGHK